MDKQGYSRRVAGKSSEFIGEAHWRTYAMSQMLKAVGLARASRAIRQRYRVPASPKSDTAKRTSGMCSEQGAKRSHAQDGVYMRVERSLGLSEGLAERVVRVHTVSHAKSMGKEDGDDACRATYILTLYCGANEAVQNYTTAIASSSVYTRESQWDARASGAKGQGTPA
ncbi:hypothetical protein QAD02_014392 [Eretmocerus hayati]|uniref:Uncharacterized protein n=1 Tax=Eretmocerus hayati TaxID=131215 RepID=A0ACC2P5E4_9HYME|nr:hypothetical protein QAD02_014392 [Eretmocerus hayati]